MSAEARIRSILAEIAPAADLGAAGGFVSNGVIDSFDVVLITGELEKVFGISIDVELILPENYDSVEALVRLVEAARERGNAGGI
jgi:acyl carrier protein